RVADEELLFAGEAAHLRRARAAERRLPGVVGRSQAREIRNVLAEGLLAVDVQIGEWRVLIVLGREPGPRSFEPGKVFRRPPVRQPAARVEERALIVEAVADLVANRGADIPVIHGRGRGGIE